jgi:hypothetical protein
LTRAHTGGGPWLARALTATLWLLALALALEVASAWRLRVWEARGSADVSPAIDDTAIWRDYGQEPITVATDLEARRAFENLEEPAREAYARERGELVVLCNAAGVVTHIYVDETHPHLPALAGRLAPGDPVWAMFGAVEAADAQQAVGLAATTGTFHNREYPVAVPGAADYIVQCYFWPYPDAPEEARLGVFVRDSMWAVLWERFRPHVHQNDSYDFVTNSLGWRDRELQQPKPPGVVRLVCIGGSTTAEGPTNHLTYPKILETKLRRQFGTDRIEVVNAGVWALATDQQVALMEDYLALEPDLLIHYNFVNDVVYRLPQYLAPQAPPWRLHNLRWLVRQSHFGYFYLNEALLPGDAEMAQFLDGAVFDSLRLLHARAGEAGVPLAVCSFAYPRVAALDGGAHAFYDQCINHMHWGRVINASAYAHITQVYNRMLAEWCVASGVAYVPVAEQLTGGRETFTDICHMTLAGIEQKAAAVAESLTPWVEAALASKETPEMASAP